MQSTRRLILTGRTIPASVSAESVCSALHNCTLESFATTTMENGKFAWGTRIPRQYSRWKGREEYGDEGEVCDMHFVFGMDR